ncbi:MAG: ribosome-associated translation inhibitor RaiA [Nitrospirae bacterium]|nr:ribosome-associated translation inhibitor RaiA [Nitrospirota bacterium]
MNVIVTGKNVDLTDALKAYAEDKVKKFDKFDANITEASFTFSLEKFRHKVEASLNLNGQPIQAESVTGEMYSSIDDVLDKLGRQVTKLKGKQGPRRQPERGAAVAAPSVEEAAAEEQAGRLIIKSNRFDPKPMTAEEAAMQMDLRKQDFFVFISSSGSDMNVVYRRKDGNIGLIQPAR